MTFYAICMCVLIFLALIGFLFAIADREKPLPPPKDDSRSWSINYMTDFKR